MTKQQRVRHTQEFKDEAVSLILDRGYSVPEVAKSLGITAASLYKGKEKTEKERTGEVLSKDEKQELKMLRKENKALRMEKEILKKARAFFAKEMR